jgi:hypothetical protein
MDIAPSTSRSPTAAPPDRRSRVTRFAASAVANPVNPNRAHSFESLVLSRNGGILIVGWIDDAGAPIDAIKLIAEDWSLTFDGAVLARVRRTDVEAVMGRVGSHSYGYFGFLNVGERIDPVSACRVEVHVASGLAAAYDYAPKLMEDADLRDLVLSYLATAQHFGNQQVGAVACADSGLGAELIAFNRGIVAEATSSPYVARFGPRRRAHRGSIVVSLADKTDPIFAQNALFSAGPGIEDYEWIYICHTPELAERALAEARIGARLYGIDQTVAVLSGNAGFGGGGNAAVELAQTDRILFMSPDLFPRDRDWADKHTRLLAERPADQTRIFGAPLFFDDGSLAHAGLYYAIEKGPVRRGDEIGEFQLAQVEHYGKGAPADAARLLAPRPVPGVTGAFMSCDRSWLERLGDFTDRYIHGDYEDADLCLKSIEAGMAPWIHDLKFWLLEPQESVRSAVYGGGSIVNRWQFSANWGASIFETLGGQTPKHPAFSQERPPLPARISRMRGLASDPRGDITDLVA